MQRALALAERGRGRTSPNPIVGSVIVRGGRIVGEGWHRRLGGPHAEIEAIEQAGPRARGATMYVTLEPCAHRGRTPPCVEALIESGIRRCVVATRDPHAIVNGRGLRRLRRGGIDVQLGLCAERARRQLGGYWLVHTRGRPAVTWKIASTLDGRIADRRGRSRWITGEAARAFGHRLRAGADAILIGAGTARLDDPRLTVRPRRAGTRAPLRVVCDTRLELPRRLRLFAPGLARGTVVACGTKASASRVRALEARGVRVWRLPERRGLVSPKALARRLVAAGCHEVLLEGGAGLGASWLEDELVDRLALFLAPKILGDGGLAWSGALPPGDLAAARSGRIVKLERHGDDALLWVELGRDVVHGTR